MLKWHFEWCDAFGAQFRVSALSLRRFLRMPFCCKFLKKKVRGKKKKNKKNQKPKTKNQKPTSHPLPTLRRSAPLRSRVMVLPVRVLTKICMPALRRSTKCHLDVVVGEGAAVFQLLAGGKDQTLLVRRKGLLILDLLLHVVDGVGGLQPVWWFWKFFLKELQQLQQQSHETLLSVHLDEWLGHLYFIHIMHYYWNCVIKLTPFSLLRLPPPSKVVAEASIPKSAS